jgi:hypothetical protein
MHITPTLLFAAVCLFSCTAKVTETPLDTVSGFEGNWTGTHKMLGIEEEFAATYHIQRVADTLVWEFTSTFEGGFTGTAVLSWDAGRAQWAESWKDSGGEAESVSYGDWDATTATMRASSPGKDWNDPSLDINVLGTTVLKDGAFDYTMTNSYPDGKTTEVMWIHMTSVQ